MEPFAGIAHEDLLKLVLSVALLLGAARLLGGLMERFKQPAVIGEIMAGVILGPSVLGGIFPAFGRLVVPQTLIQSQLLDVVALIGVMTLILMVGMETDLGLIRARLKSATAVGLGGLLIPFAFGLALGNWLPDSLLGSASNRAAFNMFLAVALALSAIPVLAKILSDLRLLRSEFGQTALAAGMIDDVLGWTLLGLVTSLATAGAVTLGDFASTLGAVIVFIALTVLIIGPATRWSLDLVLDRVQIRDRVLTLVIVFAFGWGAFTQALHLEPILGAFAVGMMFGRLRRLPVETGRQLESLTYGIFAPIFLATAGLRLDIGVLFEGSLLWITGAMLATAAAGKLIGSYLGARLLGGIGNRHAWAYGVALNARGVLGVIVASIGLSMGIFGVELYTMLVVVSLATSVMAPIGLRYLMKDEVEATVSGEPALALNRILAPVRLREDGSTRSFDPAILGSLRGESPGVTLMTVVSPEERKTAGQYLSDLADRIPEGLEVTKRVATGDPVEAIVREAETGYDMVVLGAPDPKAGPDYLFEATLDEIVRLVSCPSMIFSSRGSQWPPRRIMVPTGGADAASRAADLAFALSDEHSQVLLFHSIDPESATEMAMSLQTTPASRLEVGHGVVSALRAVGERMGVSVATEVVMGSGVVDSILERAAQDIDLLIIGTNVRAGSHRLYLGSKVERLLVEAPCSTIVFNV
ncbi:MAG: cation:proton antiporter [Acidimicrobiia bacterium]